MLMIPLKVPGERDRLIVVLGPENLERMKHGDPAELKIFETGTKNPWVVICYEEDPKKLQPFLQRNDIKGLLKYLNRGWKFQPEKGDHDRGPERLADQQ